MDELNLDQVPDSLYQYIEFAHWMPDWDTAQCFLGMLQEGSLNFQQILMRRFKLLNRASVKKMLSEVDTPAGEFHWRHYTTLVSDDVWECLRGLCFVNRFSP